MAKRTRTPDDFDSPWKDALHHYLPAFLAFFFPDIHADVDWTRGYESLDKEFQQIVRKAKVGKLLADKLFKVWLSDGTEHWLLIHVEIQGGWEEEFPGRMFDYNSAVRRLYNQEVVSLAILCDDRPMWKPTRYGYGRWGCRMELTFRIAKLLEFQAQPALLESDSNPFAAIVSAHLQSVATRTDPVARRVAKFQLVKRLFRENYTKSDVRRLFGLIDWLMSLPDDLEDAFRSDLEKYEKEKSVEYMNSIERHGFKKGHEKGERVGLLEGISIALDLKFGAGGTKLLKKVRGLADVEQLREFGRHLKRAKTIEEVREFFA